MAMTPTQRAWWRSALELKLRKSSGDSFQDFFSCLLEKAHGEDFVRVRAFGALGDKGCDGYLHSTGRVFQCYGAINGDSGKVSYLTQKMQSDFEKAKKALGGLMKGWAMVHNLVDGLPVHAIEVCDELKKQNPGIEISIFGLESFAKQLFSLNSQDISDLLGLAAQDDDFLSLQTAELRDLLAALMANEVPASLLSTDISPVPVDKLKFNQLASHWRELIEMGWKNAHVVSEYLSRHADPLAGERVARQLRDRYLDLKAQSLTPDDIMGHILEMVVGLCHVPPARQVAAFALLAYFFESCDIFEDHVSKVAL